MGVEQKKQRHNQADEIGEDLLEEIALRLAVKSLVRFSCVSKSWRSIIFFNSRFIKRYNGRARERNLVSPTYPRITSACSGYLSSKTIEYTGVIPFPKEEFEKPPVHRAQCHGLFCVQINRQLILWSPCTTSYKKLPPPPSPLRVPVQFVFGLGYDAVGDDYKLLLIPNENKGLPKKRTHLYSLKTNSWRMIPSFHKSRRLKNQSCVFMNGGGGVFMNGGGGGTLHWVDYRTTYTIVSFNLSTEKYVELVPPKYSCPDRRHPSYVELSVLKEKLCLTENYYQVKFVLWSMEEDYGWTKMFEIDYKKTCDLYFSPRDWFQIRPIYLYDNCNILVQVHAAQGFEQHYHAGVYIYAKEQGTLHELVGPQGIKISVAYVYVETLMHL